MRELEFGPALFLLRSHITAGQSFSLLSDRMKAPPHYFTWECGRASR
jgi:hypothetical protein